MDLRVKLFRSILHHNTDRIPFTLHMQALLNQENIYNSNLPASFDVWFKEKKKTAHHSSAYPDRGDIRKLLMFSLALSPIIALSFYSCIWNARVVVLQCGKSCYWLSFQYLKWKVGMIYSVLPWWQWLTSYQFKMVHFYEGHPACRANW